MKIGKILLTIIGLIVVVQTDVDEDGTRDKRQVHSPPLVYPYGGTLKKFQLTRITGNFYDRQKADDIPKVDIREEKWWVCGTGSTFSLIIGIGVPIALRTGRILAYGQNLQFQYTLPTNASFFTNLFSDSSSRRRRSSSRYERAIVYSMLEQHFERNGVDGKECIMRGICEAAETPLQEEGLVGELLHLLLTPDYGDSISVDEDYVNAKKYGLRGENCTKLFPQCPPGHGILDHVSTVKYFK